MTKKLISECDRCYDKNKAGSWNNKRTLVRNWRNVNKVCGLVNTVTVLICLFTILFFFGLFVFLVLHPQHMEVPRLRVESELQLPAYTTGTAMPDPSCICNRHHSSWQRRILNPLSETRNQTHNLMVPNWICFCCAMMGTPRQQYLPEYISCAKYCAICNDLRQTVLMELTTQ